MADSVFDPDSFLDGATAEGANVTRSEPVPEGTYKGQIDTVDADQVDTKAGARTILRLIWEVLDDDVRETLEREKVTVKQDLWLDLDENGRIATGKNKNVQLGRVREAVGMNSEGSFNPRQLVGGIAMIGVTQRSDKNDPTIKYAEVARVAPVS